MRARVHRSERGFVGGTGEDLLVLVLAAAAVLGLVLIVVRAVFGTRGALISFGVLLTLWVVLGVVAGLVERYGRGAGGGGPRNGARSLVTRATCLSSFTRNRRSPGGGIDRRLVPTVPTRSWLGPGWERRPSTATNVSGGGRAGVGELQLQGRNYGLVGRCGRFCGGER